MSIYKENNKVPMDPNITDPNGLTFDNLCGMVAPVARKHGILRMYLFG